MRRRLRLIERIGRAIRFSPEGRRVRVWVHSRPGEEDARIALARVEAVAGGRAVLVFDHPVDAGGRQLERVLAVPVEAGYGLEALWFSFISFDAHPVSDETREPLARWWMRLGGR